MVVDFQHHYVPVELAKQRGLYSSQTTYLQEGGRRATTMHARLYDLELQLKDMAEAGIDVSVLSCLLGWSATLEECRLINDDLARVQTEYSGRFVGLAQAPVLEGKEALEEIERSIHILGLKVDVPVFVHPALAPVGYDLLQDYDLPRVLGREVDLTVATTRLIAGGILDRFPKLKLVIAHFGGGIAAVKDRLLAKGYRFGTLKRPFGDYFDMLYFDLAGFEGGLPALHCALQGIRPERLVFASDYPQDFTGVNTDTGKGMQELRNYIETIRKLPLNYGTIDAILGRTAVGLLKL